MQTRDQKERLLSRTSTPGHSSTLDVAAGSSNIEAATSVVTPDMDIDYLDVIIRGSLGIRMIGLETFYTLNFQQDHICQLSPPLSPSHSDTAPREPPGDVNQAEHVEPLPQPQDKGSRFTSEEDSLLVDLKESCGLSWSDIKCSFPNRSKETLQDSYCTKLKNRVSVSEKRWRPRGTF